MERHGQGIGRLKSAPGYGQVMDKDWAGHKSSGKSMIVVWARHRQVMGRAWKGHGQDMCKAWTGHRQGIGKAWAGHRQGMGRA
jgi:hypothetical protein